MQDAFANSRVPPHWPMYLRNVKQFIKNAQPTFDEHRYGFHSFLEAVRSAQRAGLFRLERNRQGILRVFPGNNMAQIQRPRIEGMPPVQENMKPYDVEDDITLQQPPSPATFAAPPAEEVSADEAAVSEVSTEPEEMAVAAEAAPTAEVESEEKPARKRRVVSGIKRKTVTPRKSAAGAAPKKSRKKASDEEGKSES
jgi:hypothetical protein